MKRDYMVGITAMLPEVSAYSALLFFYLWEFLLLQESVRASGKRPAP